MAILFTITLFLGSALLFFIEPMIGRFLLPWLGGTPAVWNTCMVFFQTALLAGYILAHLLGSRPRFKAQFILFPVLVLLATFALPPALKTSMLQTLPKNTSPVGWLLLTLVTTIGLPFLILSTIAPLLQKWFSLSSHPRARDPYFLYIASNAGSLIALLSYPVIVERWLTLKSQARIWTSLFWVEAGLLALCAVLSFRHRTVSAAPATQPTVRVRSRQFLSWTFLAFVPSSLLLGVTTYLATDIASIPLLWIIPLALYLLTFILAFQPNQQHLRWLPKVVAAVTVALCFLLVTGATEPAWLIILLHLGFLFLAALLCHCKLSANRPPSEQLTVFYMAISAGGMLGGLFNALLAPVLFHGIAEYPLAIVCACLALPGVLFSDVRHALWDAAMPLVLGVVTISFVLIGPHLGFHENRAFRALVFGLPILASYFAMNRPVRFALCLAAVLVSAQFYIGAHGRKLWVERNFFGVLRVTYDPAGPFHRLYHGTTIHGLQFVSGKDECKPLSYYHPNGPLGDVFSKLSAQARWTNIAAVGLGAGAVITYAEEPQSWTFYEIDPGVLKVSCDANYFTYLNGCSKVRCEFVLGDARLELANAAKAQFDLLILDAFSSGMIPTHLITQEALDLYLDKLSPRGVIAFHISSRHLNLDPIVANLAASRNLACLSRDDTGTGEEREPGDFASHWVLLARHENDLAPLAKEKRWRKLATDPSLRLWTDDFVDILSIFIWK